MATAYDVVIAGGGVVGCAAALALSNIEGLNVAVIESHPPEQSDIHPSFDARVIALAHESLAHLRSWHFDIDALPGGSIEQIHVSDRKHLGQVILNASDVKVSELGKVVRLESLGLNLYKALKHTSVDYFTPEAVQSVTRTQEHVVVNTQERELRAQLLVIAEGADSTTKQLVHINTEHEDYEQSAIITNVSMQLPHQNCAFERFSKYGPIALLPMASGDKTDAGKLMSLVWTCRSEDAPALLALSEQAFIDKLQPLFGSRLGRIESIKPRFAYPLILKQSEQFTSHRCICIGNAAQSLHPIAGQGFNLGVRDIQDLLQTIKTDFTNTPAAEKKDAGSFAINQAYKKARIQDKQATIGATDMLVRTFSNHYAPMVLGRSKALVALNALAPLKAQFAKFAMGKR